MPSDCERQHTRIQNTELAEAGYTICCPSIHKQTHYRTEDSRIYNDTIKVLFSANNEYIKNILTRTLFPD